MTYRVLGLMLLWVVLPAGAGELDSNHQQISYILGMQTAAQIKAKGVTLDLDAFMLAIRDAQEGKESRLSQEQMQQAITQFNQAQAAEAEKQAAAALEEGRGFLQENESKEGVVTLPSGLQYKVLRAGSGKTPGPTDTVEVNYRGTLIDGTEFDSSYSRGKSISFQVNGVIKGWTEALQLMKEGAKWQLFIPSELAYGKRGTGQKIGPNATLVFDVELIKVN